MLCQFLMQFLILLKGILPYGAEMYEPLSFGWGCTTNVHKHLK